MANFNQVNLLGRLTSDPEARDLPSGTRVVAFSLAVTRVYYDKDKNKQEETAFIDCEMFGARADVIAQYSKKGDTLFVNGRLRQDKWDDKETGAKRSKMIVHVENFEFCGSKGSGDTTDADQEAAPPPQQNTNKAKSNPRNRPPF